MSALIGLQPQVNEKLMEQHGISKEGQERLQKSENLDLRMSGNESVIHQLCILSSVRALVSRRATISSSLNGEVAFF
jgi:hypothetical protein